MKERSHPGRIVDELLSLHNFKRLQSGRAAHWVTGVRIAVGELGAFGSVQKGVVNLLVQEHRAERQIAAIDAFGRADHIRGDARVLNGEHLARPSETGNDFIGHHEHIIFVTDRPDTLEIFRGKGDAATASQHGFGNKEGNGLRPFFENDLFQHIRTGEGAGRLRSTLLTAIAVRGGDMSNL